MSVWAELGAVSPGSLAGARLQAQWAAQWLARIAQSYVPARHDDTHTELIWSNDAASSLEPTPAFRSAPHLRLIEPFQASVEIVSDRLIAAYAPIVHKIWLGAADRPNNVLTLEGRSDDDIADILPKLLQSLGANADAFSATLPYAPAVAPAGEPADPAAAAELTRYYSNFYGLLEELAARYTCLSEVRVDARSLNIRRRLACHESQSGNAPAITAGLSPGDDNCAQPFLYVAAPALDPLSNRPPAPAGLNWRDGETAILVARAETIMTGPDARVRVDAAINDAIAILQHMPDRNG